jgi:hypothetical protein
VIVERIGKAAPVTLRLMTMPDHVYRSVVANVYDHLRRHDLDMEIYCDHDPTHVVLTKPRAIVVLAEETKPPL